MEAFDTACAQGLSNSQLNELAKKLKAMSDQHRQLLTQASSGQGWDRHLFALKSLCESTKQQMPKIFTDPGEYLNHDSEVAKLRTIIPPAYENINNNIMLSTSTMSTDLILRGGFCPVHPRGLGIAYRFEKDFLKLASSSYSADMGKAFREELQEVFKVFQKILATLSNKTSKL